MHTQARNHQTGARRASRGRVLGPEGRALGVAFSGTAATLAFAVVSLLGPTGPSDGPTSGPSARAPVVGATVALLAQLAARLEPIVSQP